MASPEIIIGLPDKHEGFQTLARRFRKAVRGCTSNSELAGGLPKVHGDELVSVMKVWVNVHKRFL